ncbi:MAG: hypothetical protein ACMVO3_01920 [Thalassobaculum sp.]
MPKSGAASKTGLSMQADMTMTGPVSPLRRSSVADCRRSSIGGRRLSEQRKVEFLARDLFTGWREVRGVVDIDIVAASDLEPCLEQLVFEALSSTSKRLKHIAVPRYPFRASLAGLLV